VLTVTLQSFLDKAEWGKPFDWDGVTFIPLMAESPLSDPPPFSFSPKPFRHIRSLSEKLGMGRFANWRRK
jgi:hypothetical protein